MSDDPSARAAALRTEIEEVRTDLGDTAEQLAAKTDVKARAQAKAEEVKSTARTRAEGLKQNPAPAIAAGVAIAVLAVWLVRRRRRTDRMPAWGL